MNQFVPQNKNSLKTFCQSSTFSLADKWEKGDIKKKKIMGTRKIRICPTPEQQIILNKWINTSRYTYNKAIHKIEKEKQKINFYNLRNKLVPKKNIIKSKEWMLDTPKDIRANSIREVVSMYKSAFTNLKNGNISKFNMRYRSRKLLSEVISIPKTAIKISDDKKKFNLFTRYLKTPIKVFKELLPDINHEIKLLHDKKCNNWYICVPIEYNVNSDNQGGIVSIDPGVKTFQTLYDANGSVTQIGSEDMKFILVELYKKIDKYKSLRTTATGRRKKNITSRIFFLNNKYKNLITEIHNKTCVYIYKNYNNVLISNIGNIKSKNRQNNRCLLGWSHGKFIERLTHHMHKNGKKINIVTEEFTSKTCGRCGWLDNNLSNKDIFHCRSCGLHISRDVNGARNILLKHLQ